MNVEGLGAWLSARMGPDDRNRLHDVLFEALGRAPSESEQFEVMARLPRHILGAIVSDGFDTVTNDLIYEHVAG